MNKLLALALLSMVHAGPPKYKALSSCVTPALMVTSPMMRSGVDLFSFRGYDVSLSHIAYPVLILSMGGMTLSGQKRPMLHSLIGLMFIGGMLMFQAYLPILHTYVALILVGANMIAQFINNIGKFGIDVSVSGLSVLLVTMLHFALLATCIGCEYFEADLPNYFDLAALITEVLTMLVSCGRAIQGLHGTFKKTKSPTHGSGVSGRRLGGSGGADGARPAGAGGGGKATELGGSGVSGRRDRSSADLSATTGRSAGGGGSNPAADQAHSVVPGPPSTYSSASRHSGASGRPSR